MNTRSQSAKSKVKPEEIPRIASNQVDPEVSSGPPPLHPYGMIKEQEELSDNEIESIPEHHLDSQEMNFGGGDRMVPFVKSFPKLVRFAGEKSSIKVSSWLKLFNVASIHCRDTPTKISMLMSYLDGQALNFFADEIASNINTISWEQVVQLFEERFGEELVCPILAANKRRLQRNESVQAYYEACMLLLRQTTTNDHERVAILTDGMPSSYKNVLIGARPSTPLQWRTIAMSLEEANKFSFKSQQQQQHQSQPAIAAVAVSGKGKSAQTKPPKPCAICKKLGKVEWHWHSECPNKDHNHSSHTNGAASSAPVLVGADEIEYLNDMSGQCSP